MRVALFVPCYVDQFAPNVASAALRVLARVGCDVCYDPDQTCCGQPLLTLGAAEQAARVARAHLARFARARADAIVCPSGSCAATVRERFGEIGVGLDEAGRALRENTFELGEFLVRRLGVTDVGAAFPHRVALLASCHGLRDLGLGWPSERAGAAPAPGATESLLRAVRGLELVLPERDECCGFGGAFSVKAPEISARMGRARVDALAATGASFAVSTDTSCLLHLDGIRRRLGRGPQPIHLAEVLASEAR